jgi:hypothetical protein
MATTHRVALLIAAVLLCAPDARAEDSRSGQLASTLVALLEEAGIEALAATDPAADGRYVAALYVPGSQLLVISTTYPDPVRLQQAMDASRHRQVYVDLHSAGATAGRLFVQDLQADGLRFTREGDDPFDVVWENGVTQTVYDGDWERQHLTRAAYAQQFAEADRRYTALLQILVDAMNEASAAPGPPLSATS